MSQASKAYHPIFMGVFLTSMAVLSLEVIFTRIFSFAIWYHFAYLTITMALLGFSASGALLAAYPVILEKFASRLLVTATLLSSGLTVLFLLIFSRHPIDPSAVLSSPLAFAVSMITYCVGITLPFFFAGVAIAAALSMFSRDISSLYFWDLVGAASGSLLSLFLLNRIEAPGGVLVCALILLAAACFFASRISRRLTLLIALAGCVWMGIIPYLKDQIRIIPCDSKLLAQAYKKPGAYTFLFSKWNAINRVDVYANLEDPRSSFWGIFGISSAYRGTLPRVHDMQYDAHNGSNIFQFTGDLNQFRFLDYHMLKTPYLLLEKPDVLILGVGGGIDVLNGLKNDAATITAVELQPITVQLLKGPLSDWVGNIYTSRENVRLLACEGRNFINGNTQRYDLIQITVTDTFAALNTGAYVLMESYLYTEEAIDSYVDALTENGIVCIIVGDHLLKGGEKDQPLNARLVLQYLDVLKARGITDARRHIAVMGKKEPNQNVSAVPLLKKAPFTEAEMEKLRSFAAAMGFFLIYDPLAGEQPYNIIGELILAGDDERADIIDRSPYNITPCSDNNPFFYNFIKWKTVFEVFNNKRFLFYTPVVGQAILLLILILSLLFSLFFILLPLLVSTKTKLSWGTSFGYLFYFLALGIGFMFIEISFIQKFVLFLGYPAYAFAITIFSLLVSCGIGSYRTGSFRGTPESAIGRLSVTLVPLLLAYIFALPLLFDYFTGESLSVKTIITMLIQMPLGFVLGMFFPLGIKVLNRVDVRMVPWAWGVNGMSSVVSSVLAIVLAMGWGFNVVTGLAVIVYLGGIGSLLITSRAGRGASIDS